MPIPIIEAFRELTGNTPRQKTEAFFRSPETAADLDNLLKINPSNEDQVNQGHQIVSGMIARGLKSGVPEDMLIKSMPLLTHIHSADPRTEIKALMSGMASKYSNHTATAPGDEEGPYQLNIPGKDQANFPDVEDIGTLIRTHVASGGKNLPPSLAQIMRVPGQKTYDAARTGAQNALAGMHGAQERLYGAQADEAAAKGADIAGITNATNPDAGVSPRQLARAPALAALFPQREKSETATDVQLKESQIKANNARAANPAGSARLNQPLGANATKYRHMDTGQPPPIGATLAQVTAPDSGYIAMDNKQEELFQGLNSMISHADLAEKYLDQFPEGGARTYNNLKMYLRTQMNDPDAVALSNQLEAMTPVAMSKALGSGGRGGAIMARMLKEAAFTGGESQATAKEKLGNLRTLAAQLAQANGLPTGPFGGGAGVQTPGKAAPAKAAPPKVLKIEKVGG